MNDSTIEPSIIVRNLTHPENWCLTRGEHLDQWMLCSTCKFVSADITDGGTSLTSMPNGFEMWLFTRYEVVTDQRNWYFCVFPKYFVYTTQPTFRLAERHAGHGSFRGTGTKPDRLTFHWEPEIPQRRAGSVQAIGRSSQRLGRWYGSTGNLPVVCRHVGASPYYRDTPIVRFTAGVTRRF